MEFLILGVAALSGLVSLACLIYVAIHMAKDYSPLYAILGAVCCQLAVFIWGWAYWQHEHKKFVMPIWTAVVIIGIILQVMARLAVSSQ